MSTTAACKECLMGDVMEGTPQGMMSELGGIKYYLSGPTTDVTTDRESKKAIVLCYDSFGLGINNAELIADELSKATSIPVYVPDYLRGDYADERKMSLIESPIVSKPLLERITAVVKLLVSSIIHVGPMFYYRNRDAVIVPSVEKFCTELRQEKGITRIGAVGYCLGGTISAKLATSTKFINVSVTAHPVFVSIEDYANIIIPFCLILAEEDPLISEGKKRKIIAVLGTKEDCELREYEGTVHGFAARPVKSDPAVQRAFEGAFMQTVDWFIKHL